MLQVQQMESDDFLVFTIILAVVALVGGAYAFWLFKRARLIEDTPTSRIRSAAQGHVELEGIASLLPGEPVIAPLSKKPCAWWKYSIEKKETTYSNGKRQTRWRTIESGTSDEMFELSDDTGTCVIDPEGAKVIPNVSLSWYGSGRYPTRAPAKSQWMGFGSFRYKESRISPQSELYALGWFRTEGGISHSFDEKAEVRDLISEWKKDKQSMLKAFDQDKDGMLDMDEWEKVRRAAIQKVRSQLLERATNPDIHVLCKPPRGLSFILSTVPQHTLIQHSKRKALVGLTAFFAFGAGTVWLLTARGLL